MELGRRRPEGGPRRAATTQRCSIQGSVSGISHGLTQRFCIDDRYPREVEYSQRLGVPAGANADSWRVGRQDWPLLLLGAAFTRPSWGGSASRDPVSYRGGINLYEYVGDDPTHFVDPLGLSCLTVSRAAIINKPFYRLADFMLGPVPVAVRAMVNMEYGISVTTCDICCRMDSPENRLQ